MPVTSETVQIQSVDEGVLLEACVYLPTNAVRQPLPVVVFGPGLTVTKDSDMQAFVDRWADDAGYASVLFDYRYFGGSGGTPRDKVCLVDQYEDYRSVLAWVRRQPEQFQADKIVAMGAALSGMSVARLAVEDGKLAGVMAHCPVLDGYATLMAMKANPRLLFWASVDYIGSTLGFSPVYIPAVGKPKEFAFLSTPDSFRGFTKMYSHHSIPYEQRPNRINAGVVYEMIGTRPGTKLSKAQCPVLIVMAEGDDIIAAKVTREVAAKAQSKVELVAVPGGHFDLLEGGPGFRDNIGAQVRFLQKIVA